MREDIHQIQKKILDYVNENQSLTYSYLVQPLIDKQLLAYRIAYELALTGLPTLLVISSSDLDRLKEQYRDEVYNLTKGVPATLYYQKPNNLNNTIRGMSIAAMVMDRDAVKNYDTELEETIEMAFETSDRNIKIYLWDNALPVASKEDIAAEIIACAIKYGNELQYNREKGKPFDYMDEARKFIETTKSIR